MNVQWNSKQCIRPVSQDKLLVTSGMSDRGQTGWIGAVSVLKRDCQARQFRAAGPQQSSTAPGLFKIDESLSGARFESAIRSALASAAPIDYQTAPPTFRLGARSSPRKQFSCWKTELDGTRHLKARPRSAWRAQTSGRPHGQEELPLLNDSGETT